MKELLYRIARFRLLSFDLSFVSERYVQDGRIESNAVIAALTLLFVASIGLEAIGFELLLIRPVIVVSYITLVPGYLAIRILQIDPEDVLRLLLYSIGVSLLLLMFIGAAMSIFLPTLGVPRPIAEMPLLFGVVLMVMSMFAVHIQINEPQSVDFCRVQSYIWRPSTLGVLTLPFLAILGARSVTRFGDNTLILFVLVLIAVVMMLAYWDYIPQNLFPLVVWSVAVSLLLHNSVLTPWLAWDVGGAELPLARDVVENGHWRLGVAEYKTKKQGMLRITLLHPIYALLADVDLLWEFKTISPLLFSLTPVAFYKSYQVLVNNRDAMLAVFLPMSLFSFFTVLSWNSRTSGALLFLSLFALFITDRKIKRRKKRVLAVAFLFGVLISHYAVSYMTLFVLPLVVGAGRILIGYRRSHLRMVTGFLFVVIYVVLLMVWYTYAIDQAGGTTFVVTFIPSFFTELSELLFEETAGTGSTTLEYATKKYTSMTIRTLQSLNIGIGAIAGLGFSILIVPKVLSRIPYLGNLNTKDTLDVTQTEYLVYVAGFTSLFVMTFGPIDKLSTARTLPPAMFFFAPLVIFGTTWVFFTVARHVNIHQIKRVGRTVAAVTVLIYFVLNTGLFGSIVAQEHHPNILIDRERVTESGSISERSYLADMQVFRVFDLATTDWINNQAPTVNQYKKLSSSQLLLDLYDCRNVSREPISNQGTCADRPQFKKEKMQKVYKTKGNTIYMNTSSDTSSND